MTVLYQPDLQPGIILKVQKLFIGLSVLDLVSKRNYAEIVSNLEIAVVSFRHLFRHSQWAQYSEWHWFVVEATLIQIRFGVALRYCVHWTVACLNTSHSPQSTLNCSHIPINSSPFMNVGDWEEEVLERNRES